MTRILRIDSSAQAEGSITRTMLDRIEARVGQADLRRDLGEDALPQIDRCWVAASRAPEAERTADHRAALALSDALIAEIEAADLLLIGVPIYNFGVPGALKIWVDLICRPGVTFRYDVAGPEGLLRGKSAILAVASGGTEVGSEADFATAYMRHVLAFVGITDTTVVATDRHMARGDDAPREARMQIAALAA
ncbi:FMN-dependent NADH-azoreductase [Jannaschia rubra]|uniref:FMN dependent NADH:quinone oxidoreductase n=1 Tax=Jannaschia rubra TaxID=282197 RepID=A0A0M6XTD3_9RHOB|nr:NAD(P)H-dependent oxidoreductase [Jannaschia rubra]CTQ33435.1 FMN-dependent NADH-azoreductase [Jannaschia rubra]SFG01798.1 FMN-dependent NADH-azoreductase [Jannaschia rubra]